MVSLNCLYIHDHIFKKINNCYFSEGKFTDDVFKRYVKEVDSINILSRVENLESTQGLNKITLNNVFFQPVLGKDFKKVFSFLFFKNLKLILNAIKSADFLVVRLPSFLGVFTLVLNMFFRRKYFIELVGDADEALLQSKPKVNFTFKVFVKLFGLINFFLVRNASGVIYVTKYSLQKKYKTKGIQEYASNVEVNIDNKEFYFSSYNKKNNSFKIGLIGSFNNNYKGIDDAIKSIFLLLEKNINVDLHILGSGKLQTYYFSLAKELGVESKIFFDGSLPGGPLVNSWLDSLDIYIQPSRTEGLPRALIEAMTRGLPAVATNVGGIPELLDTDFLITPDNPKDLANKIELLLNSQNLRYSQGAGNYLKSKEYDSIILKKKRAAFWQRARNIVRGSV